MQVHWVEMHLKKRQNPCSWFRQVSKTLRNGRIRPSQLVALSGHASSWPFLLVVYPATHSYNWSWVLNSVQTIQITVIPISLTEKCKWHQLPSQQIGERKGKGKERKPPLNKWCLIFHNPSRFQCAAEQVTFSFLERFTNALKWL